MLKICNRFLEKYGLFCLAMAIIILNVSLAFDNVVWGDEAFSGNIIRDTDLKGIFQRIYYWDSHPPLYYYWLRLMASIVGYKTYVYHIASLIPFCIGIILALTVFSKKIGKIPAAFFMVLSGFAAPCVEYNLEIRMYALLFMEVLVCSYYAYKILESCEKKHCWGLMTVFGILAAYTHYYGFVIAGILIFLTAAIVFIRNRQIILGLGSLVVYIVLYIPWLYVLFLQAQRPGNWWLEEVAPLHVLTNMIFCGEKLKTVLLIFSIASSFFILLKESELICLIMEPKKDSITWKISKPNYKNWSVELWAILLFWTVIAGTVLFTYVVSWVINPLTVARYMYPLVPILLFIVMLCVRRIFAYGNISWGKQSYGCVSVNKKPNQIFLVDMQSQTWKRVVFLLVSCVFIIVTVISLFDFKYYRSVSKTQEVQTQKALALIEEPKEDTVFTAWGVQHLSWTVLEYYYPENEVLDCLPNEVDTSVNEIWAFMGYAMSEEAILDMETKGYFVEVNTDIWLGKYGCILYHFYR